MDRDEYIRSFERDNTREIYSQSRPPRSHRKKKVNKKKLYLKRALIILVMLIVLGTIIGAGACTCNSCISCCEKSKKAAPSGSWNPEGSTSGTPETTAPEEDGKVVIEKYEVPDDGRDAVYLSDTVYLYNDKGYNIFGAGEKGAKHYADVVNSIADSLGEGVTVYNMLVPNHAEFGLPQRIIDDLGCTSQADNIQYIYDNISDDIIKVNAYNALSAHADEYIYFNTDHHWTGLGAYYGYEAFCEAAGIKPVDFDSLTENSVPEFRGTLYTQTMSSVLYNNPDTVNYYEVPMDTYADMR